MRKKYIINKRGVKIPVELIERGKKYEQILNEQRRLKRETLMNKKYFPTIDTGAPETVASFYSQQKAPTKGGETPFPELNSKQFNVDWATSEKAVKAKIKYYRYLTTKKSDIEKAKTYKENLIQSIRTKFSNVDPEKTEAIIKKINRMNRNEVAEFYYTSGVYNIDFVYSSQEVADRLNQLDDVVTDFYEAKYEV